MNKHIQRIRTISILSIFMLLISFFAPIGGIQNVSANANVTEFSGHLIQERQWIRPTPGTIIGGDSSYGTFANIMQGSIEYGYSIVAFSPIVSGNYELLNTSATFEDPMIFVYEGAFDYESPLNNFKVGDDDSNMNLLSKIGAEFLYLEVGKIYYLVTTSYNSGETGDANFTITGPDYVDRYYILTYNTGTGGTLAGNTTQAIISGGSGEEVTAIPDVGYYFDSWSDGVTSASRTDINITEELTVKANFKEYDYEVTFNTNGGSSVDSIFVNANDVVQEPTAPTKEGYTFAGWYADSNLANPFNFTNTTITSNTTIYAKWISSQTDLSNLTLREGALSPSFSPETTDYTVEVANNVSDITVTPTVADSEATVTVDGEAVVSGGTSAPISLTVGEPKTITVEVTAQDGTTKSYEIIVTRAKSSDANLSNLTISEGMLNPVFDAETTDYTVKVANDVSDITVTPTVADSEATVTVDGEAVVSGSASAPINLTEGESKTITVEVTAQNGTVKNYKAKVYRNAIPLLNDSTFSVVENAVEDTTVGTVNGTDPDQDDNISYSIVEGNNSGAFAINSSSGVIKVKDSSVLDYETQASYTLTVEGTDGTNSDRASITITVENINDNAPTAAGFVKTVDENTVNDTILGSVSSTDPDQSSVTYSIVSGNDSGAFELNSNTGQLTVKDQAQLDYEQKQSFTLIVKVDDGLYSDTTPVIIYLKNKNDNKPSLSDTTFTIDENLADGSVVGTVSGTDADGDMISYKITSGNTSGAFSIDETTGTITVSDETVLDYEMIKSLELQVEGTDGENKGTATITIPLMNLNDNAPSILKESFSVQEDVDKNTFIGTVVGVDEDGNPLSYSITDGNDKGIFEIDEQNGDITVADPSALDFEETSKYQLEVSVTDGVNVSKSNIDISILNVNDNIPQVQGFTTNMNENTANKTVVGTVSAIDADGNDLTHTIVSGNESGAFTLNEETGEVRVADATKLDFETNQLFTLLIQVNDGENIVEVPVSIHLINVNDNVPVLSSVSLEINENSALNTEVGVINGEDADGDSLSYEIIEGNDSGAFKIDESTGVIKVADTVKLDYEKTNQFKLVIQVTDGKTKVQAPVTISLKNENDNKPVVENQSIVIDDLVKNGAGIGTLAVTDPDEDRLTYEIISGNVSNIFGLDEKTGLITVEKAVLLNPEKTSFYELTVKATDGVHDVIFTVRLDVQSSDATLSDIILNGKGISLDPSVTTYSQKVGSEVTRLYLTPALNSKYAKMKLNGKEITSGKSLELPLAFGTTSIELEVEAQNGDIQTYFFEIERPFVEESISKVEEKDVFYELGSKLVKLVKLVRTYGESGAIEEFVRLNEEQVDGLLTKLQQNGEETAKIVVPNEASLGNHLYIEISKESLAQINEQSKNIEWKLPNVRLYLPTTTLQQYQTDVTFETEVIESSSMTEDILERAKKLYDEANRSDVTLVGKTLDIHTNIQGNPVMLTLPIPEELAADEEGLENLSVYVEHSDGTFEIIEGDIVSMEDGKLGYQFTVDKFSSFTLVTSKDVNNGETSNGTELPNTSTNIFNYLIIGIMFISFSLLIMNIRRKKA